MATITKAQAITLIAQRFDGRRESGETDTQLVQRIRNARRQRIIDANNEALEQVDDDLKKIALDQYYIANPDKQETVEDLQ